MGITSTLTNKHFLIGLAVGYLVIPRVAKMAMPALAKLKGA